MIRTPIPEPRRRILDVELRRIFQDGWGDRGLYTAHELYVLAREGRSFLSCPCQHPRLMEDDGPNPYYRWLLDGTVLVCTICGADGT